MKISKTDSTNSIALLVIIFTIIWFLFSRLAFTPVPWPDASAFYLPSIELFKWPPTWKMHSQAAFVPSYDIANFNMMPIVPFFLGLAMKLGLGKFLGPALAVKAVSLFVLGLLVFILWRWARAKAGVVSASILAAAALFDPVNRWGTLVVRSEIWIGLAWVLILIELSKKKRPWNVSLLLTFAAFCHFEAIILVPGVIAGTFDRKWRVWVARLWAIGWRTLVFLSPWFVYILLNFDLFQEQMTTQFGRLATENIFTSSAYNIFHSLFVSLGSPVSWPKFFNTGKAIFWLLSILLLIGTAVKRSPLSFAAAIVYLASLYLWFTKPEVWFTTLVHLTIWPWVATLLIDSNFGGKLKAGIRTLAASYAVISLLATVAQNVAVPKEYSWANFEKWIDCIEGTIGAAPGKRVWQPHVPDILVDLSIRQPTWDLTRAMDFPGSGDLAFALTAKVDAVVFSRHFPRGPGATNYTGKARTEDLELLKNGVEVPFGPWALAPGWNNLVCQVGPFWAVVGSRLRR